MFDLGEKKKKWTAALALCLALGALPLTGCEERAPAQGGPQASGPEADSGGLETGGAPSEEEEGGAPDAGEVEDPEQVAEARRIAEELLARALVCDVIYQGALRYDETMPYVVLDDQRYALVLGELGTMADLEQWLDGTFDMAYPKCSEFYKDIQAAQLYRSINGELYMMVDASRTRMTMGAWDADTLKLLDRNDERILVQMQTTLAGQDNGAQELRIVYGDGQWRLDDSYFLD